MVLRQLHSSSHHTRIPNGRKFLLTWLCEPQGCQSPGESITPAQDMTLSWLPGEICEINERGSVAIDKASKGLWTFQWLVLLGFVQVTPGTSLVLGLPGPAGSGWHLRAERAPGGGGPTRGVIRPPGVDSGDSPVLVLFSPSAAGSIQPVLPAASAHPVPSFHGPSDQSPRGIFRVGQPGGGV